MQTQSQINQPSLPTQTWLVYFTQSNKTLEEFPHLLNQITYDDLGRMIRKDMGRLPNKARLDNPNIVFAETQTIDYNIRGWWNDFAKAPLSQRNIWFVLILKAF